LAQATAFTCILAILLAGSSSLAADVERALRLEGSIAPDGSSVSLQWWQDEPNGPDPVTVSRRVLGSEGADTWHALLLVGRLPIVMSGRDDPGGHASLPHATDLFYTGTDGPPGQQGFLDFKLTDSTAVLSRDGLKLDASKNKGPLTIRARVSKPVALTLTTIPESKPRSVKLTPGDSFSDTSLSPAWPAATTAVHLTLEAPRATRIEIDSIR